CSNCTSTSSRYRHPSNKNKRLCNACWVYLKRNGTPRPSRDDTQIPILAPGGRVCSNCATRETTTWRLDNAGNRLCHACGAFERQHGRPRPSELWNKKTVPRLKRSKR
ncbi:iron transporter biosynthesis regulating transcription factor, partial [Mycena sanguinolenta]